MSEKDLQQLSREGLLGVVRDLLVVNQEQQVRIVHLEGEVARLRGGIPPSATPQEPPAFVKANRKKREPGEPKPPRKRRPHGFARRREEPTRVVDHYPEQCSKCGRKLCGGWLHATRQVLELPAAPVEVIEHRFMARHCGVCQRREFSRPDLSGTVVGQGRVGVRLMSFICYLDIVCRIPIATIQRLLKGAYGLHLSKGEIVRVGHSVAAAGESSYKELLEQVRRSPVVHADETGAREDGQNGYIWSLSTPDIRFYHRENSRGAHVIQQLLGYNPLIYQARTAKGVLRAQEAAREASHSPETKVAPGHLQGHVRFNGKLVSDFYSAYSWYGGPHQRCVVHLDRDLDELKVKHINEPLVCSWVDKVLDLIERAKDYARAQKNPPPEQRLQPGDNRRQRAKRRRAFEAEALALAQPYCRSALPQRVLAERMCRHLRQLFVFVEFLDVPADNNAAERAIRPFVILRKVSGGTRSQRGSKTQTVMFSLFGTWLLRGQDLLQACQQMLVGGAARAPT